MIKELTRKEVAQKLVEEVCFDGYVRDSNSKNWIKTKITGIIMIESAIYPFCTEEGVYNYCAIEVPDEYEPYPDDVCPNLKCGDVIISKSDNINWLVTAIDEKKCNIKHIIISGRWIRNDVLFNHYTKLDGTPIGRLKEE